jgi:lipopolysaccharide export system protein LptC
MKGEIGQANGRSRAQSFRAASRHSSHVAMLRRLILASAILGSASFVIVTWFNPFAAPKAEVSVKGTNLDGTRVTMEQPRLAGYRKDGRPYEVNADTGVQDVRQPNVIELNNLDAKIGMIDQTTVRVLSSAGIYDSFREFMDFHQAVRIRSTNYDIDMKSAKMDFKSGTMITDESVKVLITEGVIQADRMDMRDNGQNLVFEGKVRSTFSSGDKSETVSGGAAQ